MKIGSRTTNPGTLRTSISLQSPTASQDSGGFTTRSYTAQATVWSDWKNLYGSAMLASGIDAARLPAKVLIRYRSDINPSWTVVKGSVRYEIIGFDNIDERSEYIEMLVQTYKGV